MRPQANLFFGMVLNDGQKLAKLSWEDDDKVEKTTGCEIVKTGSEDAESKAIAISTLNKYIDCDDMFSPLKENIRKCLALPDDGDYMGTYKMQLEQACNLWKVEYNESQCGWFLSTYYG